MTPAEFVTTVLDPGLAWCAEVPSWNIPSDDRARVLLTAIAGQESGWEHRIQSGNGPAHGFWQFERLGGVTGVLGYRTTFHLAATACAKAGIAPNATAVWGALSTEAHDNLAVAFARLLLWSDSKPLPAVGDEEGAYAYYVANWRPGKPDRERWVTVYLQAVAAITEEKK